MTRQFSPNSFVSWFVRVKRFFRQFWSGLITKGSHCSLSIQYVFATFSGLRELKINLSCKVNDQNQNQAQWVYEIRTSSVFGHWSRLDCGAVIVSIDWKPESSSQDYFIYFFIIHHLGFRSLGTGQNRFRFLAFSGFGMFGLQSSTEVWYLNYNFWFDSQIH